MRTTGPAGNAEIAAIVWSIIRVIVSVEKSGSLKSGVCSTIPCSRSFEPRNPAFVDFADDAKPWR